MKPQIIFDPSFRGTHNEDLRVNERLKKARAYSDLSTICIIPTRGMIPAKVVQSWMNMMLPMNQKFLRMFIIGLEVGEAYSTAIETIIGHSELSKWKYILTLEEDNMPPVDGLLKLYESIGRFDVIGGIYWTKGEGGQPMIYGDPMVMPKNFAPQIPKPDCVQEANGLGMGFNLWKMSMFLDGKLPKPFFKTNQDFVPGVGTKVCTQDLYFYENAGKLGYRFACDTRVKVGHYDIGGDQVW